MNNGQKSLSINETFIIESENDGTMSACTGFFTNALVSCTGNTQILLGTNIIQADSAFSATTFFGDGSNLTGISTQDTFVTGGTYSDGTSIFTNNTGGTFSVTGFTTPFTGGTVSGPTNFTNGLTADTISATTYQNLPLDIRVTGATKLNTIATFFNNSGGTFTLTGLTDTFITGVTINNGNYDLTLYRNDGVNLTTNLGVLSTDIKITGGTYNINTGVVTFTNNTGGTFNVTGFTSGMTDSYTTGATLNGNIIEFGNNLLGPNYYNVNLNPLISGFSTTDVRVTGGTYSDGTAEFTNNTGGTFSVTGFYTGATDIYVTAVTFTNNLLTLYRNDDVTFDTTIDNFISLNVDGSVSATTFFGDGSNLSGIPTIYTSDGILASNRIVTQNSNTLTFVGGTMFINEKLQQGTNVFANGVSSHAEGRNTIANGNYSHAEGFSAITSNQYSHAEGRQTYAQADYSHAEGYQTITSGQFSHAEGRSGTTIGQGSHVEGFNNTTVNQYSHAEGRETQTSGDYSHAEGFQSTTNAIYSHAEGFQTIANGAGSHTEGRQTQTSSNGRYSHAEGYLTNVSNDYAHAEGRETTANGTYSHAEGFQTTTSDDGAHAEGDRTIASGKFSHAEGRETTASNSYSHSEGFQTQASDDGAHAEGDRTIASGKFSHAEGRETTASNSYSHAEGDGSIASGYGSHAEGKNTIAIGDYSHAEGQNTVANNSYSHVEGLGTVSNRSHQFVIGRYNITGNTTSLAVIGNGVDDLNRSDLVNFGISGVTINSDLTVVSGITANTISATTYENLPFSGTVVGSGTTNYIPKFNTDNTIDDSVIFQSGSTIEIQGDLNASGSITSSTLTGVDSRVIVADSSGTLQPTSQTIIDAYIDPNGSQAGQLNTTSNWSIYGEYIGAAITDTFQGQRHYNIDYFFECINDNDWIRLIRG